MHEAMAILRLASACWAQPIDGFCVELAPLLELGPDVISASSTHPPIGCRRLHTRIVIEREVTLLAIGVLSAVAFGHTCSVSHSIAQKIVYQYQCEHRHIQWGKMGWSVGVKAGSMGVKKP